MPNSNVKIFASFKQMEQQDVVDNPSTFDNILFYVGMGTVSVIGLIFIGLKMFNKKSAVSFISFFSIKRCIFMYKDIFINLDIK